MKMLHVGYRVMLNHLLKVYKIQKLYICVWIWELNTFLNSYQYSISMTRQFVKYENQ